MNLSWRQVEAHLCRGGAIVSEWGEWRTDEDPPRQVGFYTVKALFTPGNDLRVQVQIEPTRQLWKLHPNPSSAPTAPRLNYRPNSENDSAP